MSQLIQTKDLVGKKVWIEKPKKQDPDASKKMGKVRACVFHPQEKRCVGFIVKRPDLALMFHRKDLFVAYNAYRVIDGALLVDDSPQATDKGACKALQINWDNCVIWDGLPVVSENGTTLGLVENVSYHADSGLIDTIEVSQGALNNTLLGKRRLPAQMIKGFRFGIGAKLRFTEEEGSDEDRGAILVSDAALQIPVVGGVAEKAGEATAVATNKAKAAVESVKPKAAEMADATSELINQGAHAAGNQLKQASGMFSEFKHEYDKARGKTTEALPQDSSSGISSHEVVYVDEDGNEILFVDEEGNQITDPVVIEELLYEEGLVEESAELDHNKEAAGKAASFLDALPDTEEIGEQLGNHLGKVGDMFSEFKKEYDKARHEK